MNQGPTDPGFPTDVPRRASELRELRRRLSECEGEIERLNQLALTDALTEIANRRSFDRDLTRRLGELNRGDKTFTLLLLDLDDLKSINDQHGHVCGDDLLRAFAKALQEEFRGAGSVFRVGGDEFAVMLTETTGRGAIQTVQHFLEALTPALGQLFPDQEVSLSVGIALAQPNESERSLLTRADAAMRLAKQQDGSSYCVAQ